MRGIRWVALAVAWAVVGCGGSSIGGDLTVIVPPGELAGDPGDVPVSTDAPRDVDAPDAPDATDATSDTAVGDTTTPPTDPGPGNDTAPQDTAPQDPGTPPADPGTPPTDPGTPSDPGLPSDAVGGCDPCGYGTVAGMTCAPNSKTAMPYVKVWVDTTDCNGNPIHIETHSDAQGNYRLDLPCGTQTIFMQKGSFQHAFTRWIDKGMTTVATTHDACFPGTAARIAVITGKWDAIENTLVTLWFHFNKFDGLMADGSTSKPEGAKLLSGEEAKDVFGAKKSLLKDFDVVFINCGDSPDRILSEWGNQVLLTLRQFVMEGGSVYTSDWASVYVTGAWPAAWNGTFSRDFPGGMGAGTPVTADVVDPDLAGYLQKAKATILFGLSPLTSITGEPAGDTRVHLQGPNSAHGNAIEAFMISFMPNGIDAGRVVYTNFHNDEQSPTGDMADILQYVVFLM